MDFVNLIGRRLKDDDVIEVLERYDLDVRYDFDRLHENAADVYWAGGKDCGFQLRFNDRQVLDTIFLHMTAAEGYRPVERAAAGVPVFDSLEQAEAQANTRGVPCVQNRSVEGYPDLAWIKLDHGGYTVHYQFLKSQLNLITVAAKR